MHIDTFPQTMMRRDVRRLVYACSPHLWRFKRAWVRRKPKEGVPAELAAPEHQEDAAEEDGDDEDDDENDNMMEVD